MTQDEIDTLWQRAMRQSIENGEMYTRYHFAKLVAAHEREVCAKVCEEYETENDIAATWLNIVAEEIRDRGEQA